MSFGLAGALAAATAAAALVLARASRGGDTHVALPHPDRSALAEAGWTGGLRRWEALRAAAAVSGLAAAVGMGAPVALVPLAGLAPSVWIHVRAAAARERARGAVLPLLVAAEAALRSGTSLPDAVRRACAAVPDPIAARPFVAALRAFDLGASLEAALTASAAAARDQRSRTALGTLALGIAERLPRERLADLLAAVTDRLAFEDSVSTEVRARAAGARQQQWLIAFLVPAIALYLALTMPTLGTTLGSDLGRHVLVPAAAALEVGGIVLSRRIVLSAIR